MKNTEQQKHHITARERSRIPEYEWDRFTNSMRYTFLPEWSTKLWRDLAPGEREHICCEADFRWDDTPKTEKFATRYQIKITAVRLCLDAMRIQNRRRR